MVQYRPLNLLARFLPSRHVRRRVLPQRADLFRPGDQDGGARPHRAHASSRDGYLVLGAAETVVGLTESFKPLADQRGLYVPSVAVPRPAPSLRVVAGAR